MINTKVTRSSWVLEWLRERYGKPKLPPPDTILKTKAKLYLEYESTAAVEMGRPTSIEFGTRKIEFIWNKRFPHDGVLRKYIIWTELLGFKEFDWDGDMVYAIDSITITYTMNCTAN